ncbi:MAG: flagellar hook capping FlgD N-terminal domain-containing protein [Leptolinea sp.]
MISVTDMLQSTKTAAATAKSGAITGDQSGAAFMSLLLAQMKNQNPMEPMDDSAMISQMAQLNSLDELKKISLSLSTMSSTNQFLSAATLIDKNITYMNAEDEEMAGKVSGIAMDGTDIYLTVGSASVLLSKLRSVAAQTE